MRQDYDLIIDNLYQGAAPPFGECVSKNGFDVLVLCAAELQRPDLYPGVEVILAPGEDDARVHRMERYLPAWKGAAKLVAERVLEGKKVLVTCMAGLNRSGMVVGLALRELTSWTGGEIVELIQARRQDALCNVTFADYLRQLPGAVPKPE